MVVACPTCGDEFDGEHGMKIHHSRIHNTSLIQKIWTCSWCDEQFNRVESKVKNKETPFCSQDCYYKWERDKGRIVVKCNTCESKITKNKYYAERCDNHFCSQDCQGQWYSENIRGEEHPLWKEGVADIYGETWHQQRRKAIDRDDEQCQDCGLTRDEHYDEYVRDLEVHHITPIRTFSDTEEANQLSNLITLCKSCHLQSENS